VADADVIVTGASGFLGRYVARAAAADGARVTGIGHGNWAEAEWRAWGLDRWIRADVTLPALAALNLNPGAVFHCAGSGSVADSMRDPRRDFDRTVVSALDVLEYARTLAPDAAVVFPSSGSVYGATETMPFTVDMPLKPISPYGLHKKFVEDLARSHAASFGLRTAVVRYFSIYGPGLRKQLLWDACGRLASGDAEFGGTGAESRDWLHVEDAAALMLAAGRHAGPDCPVANGGSGRTTDIATVVTLVADALASGGRPRFSGVSRPGDPAHTHADISEALAWGWQPGRDLESGIADYVAWYRKDAG